MVKNHPTVLKFSISDFGPLLFGATYMQLFSYICRLKLIQFYLENVKCKLVKTLMLAYNVEKAILQTSLEMCFECT